MYTLTMRAMLVTSSDAHDPSADHSDPVAPEIAAGNVHLSIKLDIKFQILICHPLGNSGTFG